MKQEKEVKSAVQKLRAISKEFTNPDREAFLYGGNIDLEIEVDGMYVEEICAQIEQFIQRMS